MNVKIQRWHGQYQDWWRLSQPSLCVKLLTQTSIACAAEAASSDLLVYQQYITIHIIELQWRREREVRESYARWLSPVYHLNVNKRIGILVFIRISASNTNKQHNMKCWVMVKWIKTLILIVRHTQTYILWETLFAQINEVLILFYQWNTPGALIIITMHSSWCWIISTAPQELTRLFIQLWPHKSPRTLSHPNLTYYPYLKNFDLVVTISQTLCITVNRLSQHESLQIFQLSKLWNHSAGAHLGPKHLIPSPDRIQPHVCRQVGYLIIQRSPITDHLAMIERETHTSTCI